MALVGTEQPFTEPHVTLQQLLDKRERLVQWLERCKEAGDLETAALLEFGIDECDGLIALLATQEPRH